jgi:hypothetical protein
MNSNATVREIGQQRADELSAVYSEIIGNYTFQNFDMAYYDFPFAEIWAEWQQRGCFFLFFVLFFVCCFFVFFFLFVNLNQIFLFALPKIFRWSAISVN